MEYETKQKKNHIVIILLFLFIIFMILYISREAGYYEYKAHQKVVITEDAIKEFEKDVAEGKDVNASDYITVDNKDYSNKFSVLGSKIGETVETFMNKRLKKTIKVLGKLFWE